MADGTRLFQITDDPADDPTIKFQDLQLRKALEVLSQLQQTMKVMVENTHHLGCKWDNLLQIVQEMEQEEANNQQLKKAEEVIVDQTEKFQKLRAECDLAKQKIKNDDVLVQEFVKEKSDDDWPYYDAEQLFDEKLKSVPAQKEFTKSVPVLIMKKLELLRGMFWHYASVFFLWRIFWERNMYMKLDYLKYLVGLRHRWRWKYRCQLLLAQDPSSNHTVEVRLQVDEPKQAKKIHGRGAGPAGFQGHMAAGEWNLAPSGG